MIRTDRQRQTCRLLPLLRHALASTPERWLLRRIASLPILAACLLATFLPAASAQTISSGDVRARFDRGLFWRIERTGIAPSHLFGTIHVSDPRVARLPVPVADALGRATAVATEVDFDHASIGHATRRLTLPEGRSLRELIGDRDFRRTTSILVEDGIGPDAVARLTPFGAITYLTIRPKAFVGTLDLRVFRTAREHGARTVGLETVEEQFNALDHIGDESFIAELRAMVANPDAFRAYMETLVAHYLAESTGKLLSMVRENPPWTRSIAGADPRVGAEIVDKRNRRMVERMLPLVREGGAFVAVGASHLGGEEGILAMLERRGYRVTRVPLDQ